MTRLLYYIVFKPLSLLPLRVTYTLLSPLLYALLWIFPGYRKSIVLQNLENSFPEKSPQERLGIARKHYRHLADVMVESVRLLSMSEKEVRKRYVTKNPEILLPYLQKKQNVIITMAHLGNWEIAPLSAPLYLDHKVIGVYAKIKNKFLEETLNTSRSRFGTKLVERSELLTSLRRLQDIPHALVLIADQNPSHSKNGVWTNFLHQDTYVNYGPERLARLFGYAVFYTDTEKVGRGMYRVIIRPLLDHAETSLPKNELTKRYIGAVQTNIVREPYLWLWTHRRWKRKRT